MIWVYLAGWFGAIALFTLLMCYLSPRRLARWAAQGASRLARFASEEMAFEMEQEEAAARLMGRPLEQIPPDEPSYDEVVRRLLE